MNLAEKIASALLGGDEELVADITRSAIMPFKLSSRSHTQPPTWFEVSDRKLHEYIGRIALNDEQGKWRAVEGANVHEYFDTPQEAAMFVWRTIQPVP